MLLLFSLSSKAKFTTSEQTGTAPALALQADAIQTTDVDLGMEVPQASPVATSVCNTAVKSHSGGGGVDILINTVFLCQWHVYVVSVCVCVCVSVCWGVCWGVC